MAPKPTPKEKRSSTLSAESVAFQEEMPKLRSAINRAVGEYYASLSDDQRTELTQWGEFAERNFPAL